MRKKYAIYLVMIFFLCCGYARACADTAIKSDVDKTKLSIDETLTYKVIVTSGEKNLPAPKIPAFKGFRVVSQAQSTTASLKAREIKSILVYAFILAPVDAGTFTIEPALITLKKETYSSEPIKIEVLQGKTKPESQPEKSMPKPKAPALETEPSKITL